MLTESEDESEEPELQHANTILQGGDVRVGAEGMNAEELNSDREDANNTQFELGKLISKKPLAAKELDDAAKNVT